MSTIRRVGHYRQQDRRPGKRRTLIWSLKADAEPLKSPSRAKVKEALGSISDVLNALSMHHMDSTTMFEGVEEPQGALALLYVLDDGLQAEQAREERLTAGEYREADFQARDL